ncbi:MAG: cytochrome b561 [Parvibaculaceae bacterium]|jgi:cytochrome b561|nr:cytochrome b/b6 domain-containing protein [Parvibaculaceae bacterium]|tara:strand:- start:155 stop:325 length:171 start_codon:yes stop_codon:yes gene_type:complete
MDFIHKQGGAYVIRVLIAVHAGAALYHHFVRPDIVLKRMISPSLIKDYAPEKNQTA